MIFAITIGLLLGLSGLQSYFALPALAASLFVKVLFDIRYDRIPLLDRPSSYAIYRFNLERTGEQTDHAWISYGLQYFIFGGLAGAGVFAVVRHFSQ